MAGSDYIDVDFRDTLPFKRLESLFNAPPGHERLVKQIEFTAEQTGLFVINIYSPAHLSIHSKN